MIANKNNVRLNIILIFWNILFSIEGILSAEVAEVPAQTCKTSWTCGVKKCCRDRTGKNLSYDPYGFGVRSWVIPGDEHKQGVCSGKLAQKGEICDSNCMCEPGFKCYRPLSFNNCCSQQTCLEAEIVDYRRKFERKVWKECLDDPHCPLPGVRDWTTSASSTMWRERTNSGTKTPSMTAATTSAYNHEDTINPRSSEDSIVIQTITNVNENENTNNAISYNRRNPFGRWVIGEGGRELPKYDPALFERSNKEVKRKGDDGVKVSQTKAFVPEILDYEENVKLHQSLNRYNAKKQTNMNVHSPQGPYRM